MRSELLCVCFFWGFFSVLAFFVGFFVEGAFFLFFWRARLNKELESGVRAMSGLRDQLDDGLLGEISDMAEGDYRRIRELGLSADLTDVVIGSLGRLVDKLR